MNHHSLMLDVWKSQITDWLPVVFLPGLLVYLIRCILKPNRQENVARESPLEMLKRRYARGEITRDEYEQAQTEITEQ